MLFTPDYPLAPQDREPFSWRRVASSYWISPRAYPDFGWAWLTRFLASLSIAMGTLYLLYFLRDAVHYARLFPGQTAADGLLILILIYTGCVVLTSIVGGIISDRSGRRKMLVTVSGLLMAAAALLLTFWETWPAALGAAVLYGMGYGAYIAVDQALITQVLPKAHDRAKDLGIINIAIVCPGAIGALIAAPLVSLAGLPGPVRGDGGGGHRGLDRGLANQERPLSDWRRPLGPSPGSGMIVMRPGVMSGAGPQAVS